MKFSFAGRATDNFPPSVLAPERHRALLRLLAHSGRLTLEEMQSRFGVSTATARRDAEAMASAGLAQRTRGGLLPPDFSLSEPAYRPKAEIAAGVKARLGRAVAQLLPEAGTVFIDAGSTCLEVGRALLDRSALRIFTNSVPLLALAGEARATLTSIGGEVRPVSLALTGSLALAWLESLRFDAAVIGASGLDSADGPSTTEIQEAGVKVEALRRARLKLLVAHADKWGRPAAVHFASWRSFHHFITNRTPTAAERAALAAAGVRWHSVPRS
jgi:DeoR/GlpR family transcriptional regulator of sugar metabolism